MERIEKLLACYSDTLYGNFVPFWETVSPDPIYGGFLCGFDRDGELFYEDKSVWQQGRSLWMFAKLYNEHGGKEAWLSAARSGYDFINAHCFDEKGHMYFRVTRDGRPLVNRRYYFSEAFAIMGYVEYFLATKDPAVRERAIALYRKMYHYYTTPGCFPPKVEPSTRKRQGHSIVMIMLNVSQYMRRIHDDPLYDEVINDSIKKITEVFIKEDKRALLETVDENGEFIDTPEGRLVNPGHALETAWFLMREAIARRDRALMERAITVTEWSLEIGRDSEKGGIFYFRDVMGKPVLSLEWDMKLCWVHCEALIALLYSYMYTGEEKYFAEFEEITEYLFAHFADEGHPEWFGHLHRDGTPISYIKGSDWKGPFHNVRAFMVITELLTMIKEGKKLDFGGEEK